MFRHTAVFFAEFKGSIRVLECASGYNLLITRVNIAVTHQTLACFPADIKAPEAEYDD